MTDEMPFEEVGSTADQSVTSRNLIDRRLARKVEPLGLAKSVATELLSNLKTLFLEGWTAEIETFGKNVSIAMDSRLGRPVQWVLSRDLPVDEQLKRVEAFSDSIPEFVVVRRALGVVKNFELVGALRGMAMTYGAPKARILAGASALQGAGVLGAADVQWLRESIPDE